ncbi:MAG: apolipoprotein N-acyltransferase [Thermodesulfobacteriota bacterium]
MPSIVFALLAVLLLYLASPGGPGLPQLAWLALVPLCHFCRKVSAKQAFWQGWLAFFLYQLFTIYWVVISMEQYGGLSRLLSWTALTLLAIYMALYPAIFCVLISRLDQGRLLWGAPLTWVSLEYLRGHLFSGLPWLDLAYSQHGILSVIQCVDLGGHLLLSLIIVMVNVFIYRLISAPGKLKAQPISAALALLAISATLGYGPWRLEQITAQAEEWPKISSTIIQANIDQSVKWLESEKQDSVDRHIALTKEAQGEKKARLIIWPETALPFFPTLDPLMAEVMERTVMKREYNLLAGAPFIIMRKEHYEFYNGAMLLHKDGSFGHYFKRHLVPFGEYTPLGSILPLPGPLVNTESDFSPGTSAKPLELDEKSKVGMLICVEAIYPELARKSTVAGATLLANITNDGWFGRSSAPHQHLAMTTFRAVENRRSLARAANTGISAFILPSGRLDQTTPLFEPAHISSELPINETLSFFSRWGHLFPLLALAAALLIITYPGRRRGRRITIG